MERVGQTQIRQGDQALRIGLYRSGSIAELPLKALAGATSKRWILRSETSAEACWDHKLCAQLIR